MNDTVKLLKECDSGTKMAVTSIDELLTHTRGIEMKNLLNESKEKHEELGNKIHEYLDEIGASDKDPNPMAKGMSWMKINMKIAWDENDRTVADLMTDGCNMGIKSINKYINEYSRAKDKAKKLADEIIQIETDLVNALKGYL